MKDQAIVRQGLRESKSRRHIVCIGILQSPRVAVLSTDENRRLSVVEREICICVTDIHQRIHELVAQANFNCGRTCDPDAVLSETIRVPLAKLHLRNTGLALLYRRETKQKAGQG